MVTNISNNEWIFALFPAFYVVNFISLPKMEMLEWEKKGYVHNKRVF